MAGARAGVDVDHRSPPLRQGTNASGSALARCTEAQAADHAEHEGQPQGIGDEAGDADRHAAEEDDQVAGTNLEGPGQGFVTGRLQNAKAGISERGTR